MSPLTATYRTKDDRHVQLMFLQGDRYWPEFCRTVDRADLADDVRFVDMAARRTNAAACVAELDAIFAGHTLDEWKEILAKLDAPWSPIQSIEELVDDPQVLANSYIGDVEIDGEVVVPIAHRPSAVRRSTARAEAGARARRTHRGDPDRTRLRLGPHRRTGRRGSHSVTTERPLPVPDESSAPYWAAAAQHVLTVARCGQCGNVDAAARRGVYRVRFDRSRVRVHSGERARRRAVVDGGAPGLPARLRPDLPFVLVDVELAEQADLRLIGRLLDGVDAELRLGAAVRVVFEDLRPRSPFPHSSWCDDRSQPGGRRRATRTARSSGVRPTARRRGGRHRPGGDRRCRAHRRPGRRLRRARACCRARAVVRPSTASASSRRAGWRAASEPTPRYVAGFDGIGQLSGSVGMAVNALISGAADYVLVHRALHNPRAATTATQCARSAAPRNGLRHKVSSGRWR